MPEESVEIKFARLEEQFKSLCRSVDMLREEVRQGFHAVGTGMKMLESETDSKHAQHDARLTLIECMEERRKGSRTTLLTIGGIAGAFLAWLGNILKSILVPQ